MLDFLFLQMDERGLLVDALKQLDELFLLVVVGEFNSGKSSVINALLGGRFLEEVRSANKHPLHMNLVNRLLLLNRAHPIVRAEDQVHSLF